MQSLDKDKSKLSFKELGLGIEHFVKKGDKKFLKEILDEAYNLGITHFDLVYNYPHFFEVFKEFIGNKKSEISFSTHIGQVYSEKSKKSKKSRTLSTIKRTMDYIFEILDIDSIDTGMVQYITNLKDFETIKGKGILDYAYNLKKEEKIKSIGVSGHNQELLLKIIKDSKFDVVMFPYNFVTGHLPLTKELISECKQQNIKIMGIKTLLHGKAFSTKKVTYPKLMSCFSEHTVKLESPAFPYQCFNHALKNGIDQIIFGVKNREQLRENVLSYKSHLKINDYSNIVDQFVKGQLN